MTVSTMRDKERIALRVCIALLWLGLWQLLAMCVGRDFILSSPLQVLTHLCSLALTADFWQTLLCSALHILSGFAIGLVSGVFTATCSAHHRLFREIISPLCAVIRAIPVASYVVLALFWLPSRSLSVFISAMVTYPLIYAATLAEIGRTDNKMLEMARLFRLPRRRRILYCHVLPALPGMAVNCSSAIGMAFKSGVAAELICIPGGTVGERLYRAKVYLMNGELLAWTVALILLSTACSRLLAYLLRIWEGRLCRGSRI